MVKIIKEAESDRKSTIKGRMKFYQDIEKELFRVMDVASSELRIPYIESINIHLPSAVLKLLNDYEWTFGDFDSLATKYESMFSDSDDPYNAAFDAIEKRIIEILQNSQKQDALFDVHEKAVTKTLTQILNTYIDDLSDVIAEIINDDDVEDVFGKSKTEVINDIRKKGIPISLLRDNPELTFVELEGEDNFDKVSEYADGLVDNISDSTYVQQLSDYNFDTPFSKSKAIGRYLLGDTKARSFEDAVTTKYSEELKNKILSKV